MKQLQDQVAVITGASSGIGEATARILANAGAKVVLAARRIERLQSLQNELTEAGHQAISVPTDVTDRKSVEQLFQQTLEQFGKVDILVNNAGIMLLSFVQNVQLDEWEKMIDVNIKGLMFCTGAVIPTMIAQKSGHIINISSMAGRRVFPSGSVYCATKFAVNAFSEGLRQELSQRHGIRVTSVAPGVVETELTNHITDDKVREGFKSMREKVIPLQAIDIAEAVLYAVSNPSRANVHDLLILPTTQS